jgi:excisionase family DNA binding protein
LAFAKGFANIACCFVGIFHLFHLLRLFLLCGKINLYLYKGISMQPLIPTSQDIDIAKQYGQKLASYRQKKFPVCLQMSQNETIPLPAYAIDIITDIFEKIASGETITIISQSTELTTAQAAKMLYVSRPFLIKQLEEGKIPFRKVGRHRRIRLEDIVAYKNNIDNQREKALEALTLMAQQENMGY